jgi:hypothetical protein
MNVEYLKSTDDLRRVQRQMHKRIARMKVEDSEVYVSCAGGLFKARLSGSNIVAFGETASEAKQRLTKLLAMQSVCIPQFCDQALDRAERRGNRA